jgi:hypothetical protein
MWAMEKMMPGSVDVSPGRYSAAGLKRQTGAAFGLHSKKAK